jgi:hypothetical protein
VVDRQEALTLRAIPAEEAAAALVHCESLDPRGVMTPGDVWRMAQAGQCFALEGGQAAAVYVVRVVNDVVWVDAVRGAGDADVTELVDRVLTRQAEGCRAIALQTKRRGLVRKLQRHGYSVTGWVMRKELE